MKHGFSLVELSIVLVILGLLVGGVLAGQSLIRAAELRSISTDFNRYKTAMHTFRDKYFALPGDMTNATSFWGDQATGTGSCASGATADGTPGTCNGNGDGVLAYAPNSEPSRLWQHLAMAGLIEGNYSGIGILDQPGVNIPASKMSGAGFAIFWMTASGFVSGTTGADPNRILVGKAVTGTTGPGYALLKPEEGWNIDTKLDDGNPYTGALRGGTGTGYSSGCDNGATYRLTSNALECTLTLVAQ